ncbi:MAG: DUF2970 domain-containing protein [Oceanococcaceae bacterium]
MNSPCQNPESDRPGFWQVLWSTLAAFFGVQNRSNRERDFTRGKASHFILMGLMVTVAFVVVLAAAVKLALAAAG